MTNITQWAIHHGVSQAALNELIDIVSAGTQVTPATANTSEQAAQNAIRLEASNRGIKLFRNNVGACQDSNGNFIRYGIANDTPAMNKAVKSADLIGFTPVTIGGQRVAVFTSIEVKKPGWKFKNTGREQAQNKWREFVLLNGGFAIFATSPKDLDSLVTL